MHVSWPLPYDFRRPKVSIEHISARNYSMGLDDFERELAAEQAKDPSRRKRERSRSRDRGDRYRQHDRREPLRDRRPDRHDERPSRIDREEGEHRPARRSRSPTAC